MAVEVVLALGSNLGQSEQILEGARRSIAAHERIELVDVSPVLVTDPVGGPEDQPDFLNQVLLVRTDLRPFALLEQLQGIETEYHRVRAVRWGPRTLDIDIIAYGQLEMDEPDLTLPHPRAHERAFVLEPWARMDPDAVLRGSSVAELARRAPDAGGVREYSGISR